MDNQKDLILNGNWNTLVILDACRYDYFKDVYSDYLDGDLKKVKSPASSTQPWLKNTFDNRKYMEDTIYVSANPFCNSKGIDFIGFDGLNRFYDVVDCWESGWDDEIMTVKPQIMSKLARVTRGKYPSKRLIVHFLQPHDPYLGYDSMREKPKWIELLKGEREKGIFKSKTPIHAVLNFLRGVLGLNPNPIEEFEKKYGEEELKKAYENNLRIVLEEVKKIIERVPDKNIIITADHGELLGENGEYRHPSKSNNPILREVPWLEAQ